MTGIAKEKLGRATEDYVKAIFKLQEKHRPVSTNRVADKLDVSPAAVTKAFRVLVRKGLVDHEPYHGVSITPAGRSAALEIIRRHRLLETFLHDVLGYSWDEVDAEAEQLEHHISAKFEAAIDRLLGFPSLDPHGDPIPDRDGAVSALRGTSLAESKSADTVVVVRVRDRNPAALQYLAGIGVHVGAVIEIVEIQPFSGPLTLRIDAHDRVVGRELADYVFVDPWRSTGDTSDAASDDSSRTLVTD